MRKHTEDNLRSLIHVLYQRLKIFFVSHIENVEISPSRNNFRDNKTKVQTSLILMKSFLNISSSLSAAITKLKIQTRKLFNG